MEKTLFFKYCFIDLSFLGGGTPPQYIDDESSIYAAFIVIGVVAVGAVAVVVKPNWECSKRLKAVIRRLKSDCCKLKSVS